MRKRECTLSRNTEETKITLNINLDGKGEATINTGIGFFDHMLNLMAFHGEIDMELVAKGDLQVCDHHTIEDVGIVLGQAFKESLGDKKGINRYGWIFLPMDEALIQVSLDLSGRGILVFQGDFKRERVGDFSTEMVKEFLRAFAFNGGITLHTGVVYGENDHHKIEGIFKALGRAIKEGKKIEEGSVKLPSTKGLL